MNVTSGAHNGAAGGGQVIGVNGGDEGGSGNKLHIVPSLSVNEAARSNLNVFIPFSQARTKEGFGLLLVSPENWSVGAGLALHQELQERKEIDRLEIKLKKKIEGND